MTKLPIGMLPRGLTRDQAAEYCGCSVEAFDDGIRRGDVPAAMPGGGIARRSTAPLIAAQASWRLPGNRERLGRPSITRAVRSLNWASSAARGPLHEVRALPRPHRMTDVRFRVEPGDIPAENAARRLHLTPAAFEACKVHLFMRSFPRPDPDIGMYDVEAIDRWRHPRHPTLFPELVALGAARTPALARPAKRLGDLAREGKQKRREAREQLKPARQAVRTKADG